MEKTKHIGLDYTGIILNYVGASLIILGVLISTIEYGYMTPGELIALIYSFFALIINYAYHSGENDNYILAGIIGIFVSFLGGIFILLSRSASDKGDPNKINSIQISEFTKPVENTLAIKTDIKTLESRLMLRVIMVSNWCS
jgi:hypothetical protein